MRGLEMIAMDSIPQFCTSLSFLRVSQVAPVVKNPPANEGDISNVGLIPVSGRSPGGGNGNPLQYSCLANPVDRGAWLGYSPWGHRESDVTHQAHACVSFLKAETLTSLSLHSPPPGFVKSSSLILSILPQVRSHALSCLGGETLHWGTG